MLILYWRIKFVCLIVRCHVSYLYVYSYVVNLEMVNWSITIIVTIKVALVGWAVPRPISLMLLIHCLVVTEWTMELISSTPSPAKMDKTAI